MVIIDCLQMVSLKDDGTDNWTIVSLNWAVVHGLLTDG